MMINGVLVEISESRWMEMGEDTSEDILNPTCKRGQLMTLRIPNPAPIATRWGPPDMVVGL